MRLPHACVCTALALTTLGGSAIGGSAIGGSVGCTGSILPPALAPAAAKHDALALSDGLEAMIDARQDQPEHRWGAYDEVCKWPQPGAEYAFARAALAGRVAQLEGVRAIAILGDMEEWARKSIQRDATFRDGAATRMLATLYVLAPGSMVDHGDSESGLEMLEALHERDPTQLQTTLRLAEAYIALDDHEPAYPLLCDCLRNAAKLRPDDQRLLSQLTEAAGGHEELACNEQGQDD